MDLIFIRGFVVPKKIVVMLIFFTSTLLSAQNYPMIELLNERDINFKQLISDIQENNRRLANKKELLPLMFYGYQTNPNDTLYKIAARLNITYDSIAMLNGMASPLMFNENQLIFLPNISGLALRGDEQDSFLRSVATRLDNKTALSAPLYLPTQTIITFFVPNERFNKDERLLFLQGFFRSPLNGELMITSGYGTRNDPFGLGATHHHNGFDYRASIGTNVYSSRGGVVSSISHSSILGLHVIINHENGYQTIYGHLSEALVTKGQRLNMGRLIAKSGNSGNSTGPHLHFEVRKNGLPVNPASLLNDKF